MIFKTHYLNEKDKRCVSMRGEKKIIHSICMPWRLPYGGSRMPHQYSDDVNQITCGSCLKKLTPISEKLVLDNLLPTMEKILNIKINNCSDSKVNAIKALLTISERECLVIILHNLLGMTLQDIGNIIGVSKERVRQIEAKGFRKLKHPSRRKLLWHHQKHILN